MKRIILGALLLLSTVLFSQNYSGSVYLTHDYTGSIKYYSNSQSSSEYEQLIPVNFIDNNCEVTNTVYVSPFVTSPGMNGINYLSKGMWEDILIRLNVFDNCNPNNACGCADGWGVISTDPNNPTIIPVSEFSDLLYYLRLSANEWSPHTFNPSSNGVTLHFTMNSLSTSQNSISQLLLYPNPSSGVFNLSTDTEKTIKVIDITGKLVINANITNILDASILAPGVYFCEIQEGENKIIKRLIKS